MVLAGLVALHAQGSRLAQDANSHASRLPAPTGERWFDKVPDREPLAQPASTAPAPAPALPQASAPPAKTLTDGKLEAQRRARALRAAMAAPIAAVALEARSGMARGGGSERPATRTESAQTPAAIVPAAALAAAQAATAGLPPAPRAAFPPPDRPEVLPAALRPPASRYEVKAGTIIPAVLVTGVNSDLPGQLIAQVREPVFDTESGQHLLVPQGARLIGLYDHHVAYGQERVLVTWKRVIFPNGSRLSLKDGMPGTDPAGAAGFNDQVNHRLVRVLGNALLLSVFSAGVQLTQIPSFGQCFNGAQRRQRPGRRRGTGAGPDVDRAHPPRDEHRPDDRDPTRLRRQRNGDPGPRVPRPVRRHGAPMKLKPVQTYPDAALKGRVPGELHAALTAYTSYYHETTGQPIEVWSLVVQMLQRFVETDREFQTWRRRTQNGPGPGPLTS